jgi:hypothetical protein
MEDQQNEENNSSQETNKTAVNDSNNLPDEGFSQDKTSGGMNNEVIESHSEKRESGYKIAIEDTMIGYDGHDDPIDLDQGNGDVNSNDTRGTDDNN